MRKTLLIVLFVLASLSLFALDDLDKLSAEQRIEYLNNSLSVMVGSETQSTFTSTAFSTSKYSASSLGIGSSSTQTVWKPYFGSSQISKSTFFKIVGDENLYEQALQFEKEKAKNIKIMNTLLVVGCSVSVVGLCVMMAPLFMLNSEQYSKNYGLQYQLIGYGTIISGVGLGVMAIAIPFETASKKDLNISAQYAMGLADSYNHSLYESFGVSVKM